MRRPRKNRRKEPREDQPSNVRKKKGQPELGAPFVSMATIPRHVREIIVNEIEV